jgi:hypothetical protein
MIEMQIEANRSASQSSRSQTAFKVRWTLLTVDIFSSSPPGSKAFGCRIARRRIGFSGRAFNALSQKTDLSTTSGGPRSRMPPRCCPIDYCSCSVLNCPMSVILEINRDFPFQVPLSFDEAAMDILDWLEGCAFEWDMYVDLPANTVRYCCRMPRLSSGSSLMRRKGELEPHCLRGRDQIARQMILPRRNPR